MLETRPNFENKINSIKGIIMTNTMNYLLDFYLLE